MADFLNELAYAGSPYEGNANLIKMNPEFMFAFDSMAQDYFAKTGKQIKINDAWRSYETQQRAFREKPGLAAPAGHSLHESGSAMDINETQANELDQLGLFQKYGFYRPMMNREKGHKYEPWHIQLRDIERETGVRAAEVKPSIGDFMSELNAISPGQELAQIQVPGQQAPQPFQAMPFPQESISAEGKPRPSGEMMPPQSHETAPYHVLAHAASVDEPRVKFQIFARNRFPYMTPEEGAKRYFIKDGDIYYLDNTGTAYKEVAGGVLNKVKSVIAEMSGHAPEMVGGVIGEALGGPVGAGLGVGAGGLIRKGIGMAEGERPSYPDIAETAVKDVLGGAVGSLAGRGVTSLANKAMAMPAGYIGRVAARDIPFFNPSEMQRLIDLGRTFGIDLTAPEIANSPTLRAVWANLAKTPGEPAEKIATFIQQVRVPQVRDAISRELGTISQESDLFRSGGLAVEGARDIEAGLKGAREAAAGPQYRAASKSAPAVDVDPVRSRIDELLLKEPQGSSSRGALEKIRTMLSTAGGEPETSLDIMHNTKLEIDRMLDAAKQDKSLTNKMRQQLMDVKEELLTRMDAASPQYASARQTFQQFSKPINDFRYGNPDIQPRDPHVKTVVARLADLGEEDFAKAPRIVFDNSSVEQIKRTRQWFQGQYPEAWDALVRARLQDKLETAVKDSVINQEGNVGYAFKRTVFGNMRDVEKLRAALSPQQFTRMRDFMEVLDATNKIIYSNSQTAFQLATDRIIRKEAGGLITRALRAIDITRPTRWIADLLEDIRQPQYSAKLASALVDPAQAQALTQIKRLPNTADKAIRTGALLSAVFGKERLGEAILGPQEVPPEVQQ